jgi:arsenate reductase (thioredoxin)
MSPSPLTCCFSALAIRREAFEPSASCAELGKGNFRAFSAGSYSKGEVHPLALLLLSEQRVSTEGLRSKSRDEFAKPGAPVMNFVFTVCDQAAGEVCPVWPGQLYGAAGLAVHRGCVPGSHRADGSPSRSLSRRLH